MGFFSFPERSELYSYLATSCPSTTSRKELQVSWLRRVPFSSQIRWAGSCLGAQSSTRRGVSAPHFHCQMSESSCLRGVERLFSWCKSFSNVPISLVLSSKGNHSSSSSTTPRAVCRAISPKRLILSCVNFTSWPIFSTRSFTTSYLPCAALRKVSSSASAFTSALKKATVGLCGLSRFFLM